MDLNSSRTIRDVVFQTWQQEKLKRARSDLEQKRKQEKEEQEKKKKVCDINTNCYFII